jgi:hypothetical protein
MPCSSCFEKDQLQVTCSPDYYILHLHHFSVRIGPTTEIELKCTEASQSAFVIIIFSKLRWHWQH